MKAKDNSGRGKHMILTDTFNIKKPGIVSAKEFLPFPKPNERKSWEGINSELREYIVSEATKHTGRKWNNSVAMDYINYFRNERLYDNHSDRNILLNFICAECIENQGRFIEDIVNGVWSFCEKTDWIPPQHLNHMYDYQKNYLPDIEENNRFIDLHIGMTASTLAWAYYFHKEKLDEITPLICKRIKYEIRHRVFETLILRKDFGWMGFVPSRHKVNNWNPFIISHCMECVMILEDDAKKRSELCETMLRIVDNYYDILPDDGGCDEGPHYWSLAGGALYDILEIMHYSTKGEYNLFENEKVRSIAQYMNKVHIHKNYFVNFADTRGKTDIPMALYRFGKYINDDDVSLLGTASPYQHGSACKYRLFADLLMSDGRFSGENKVKHTSYAWLDKTQIGVARESADTHEGLFMAFKGGNNDESHNHNDVGNFIVYSDGMPAIIDVGMGTYVPITFSDRRYELYNTQSAYHNLPTINLCMQEAGKEFKASCVEFNQDKDTVKAKMSLKDAYPEEANICKWVRTYELDRINSKIVIEDSYKLEENKNIRWTLMTNIKPQTQNGKIKIAVPNARALDIEYDNTLETTVEQLPLNAVSDGMIKKSWGELFRIVLTQTDNSLENTVRLIITQEGE